MFKLVAIDNTQLTPEIEQELSLLCSESHFYRTDPNPLDEEEIFERAKDANIILVSWRTPITRELIQALPHLKYVGMCCSLIDEHSANVDIAACRERNIQVKGVRDYGDEGLVEFIIHSLIGLFHGFTPLKNPWSLEQQELTGKTLGIIGFGATGQMLAHRALAFGMKVIYYSRSRKPMLEVGGIEYRPLDVLMMHSDVISTHLPKHTVLLNHEHLNLVKDHCVLVNTSLGPTFDLDAYKAYMQPLGHYSIFDGGGLGAFSDPLTAYDNVIYTHKVTGFTDMASVRLSRSVLNNFKQFLNDNSIED